MAGFDEENTKGWTIKSVSVLITDLFELISIICVLFLLYNMALVHVESDVKCNCVYCNILGIKRIPILWMSS